MPKRESKRMGYYLVRYDETNHTFELGDYVSGPGVELLRSVLEQLNRTVRLEIRESA